MSVTSYIQGHDAATLASHQSRSAEKNADYLLGKIRPDSAILDIGCGPGTITCDFARLAPKGRVVGLDYSDSVIKEAQAEARKRGIGNIDFRAGDAHALPFEDDSFDIVHAHAVLIHLPQPLNAVKEMRRVCKPGGYVAAREPDWATCVIHPEYPALEKWKTLHTQLKQREGAEPNAGRHLASWAVAAGFESGKVQLTSNVLMYTGRDQVNWWGKLYAARMKTEIRQRAIEAGLATAADIVEIEKAYLDWSEEATGVWAMMHMCVLCQK
ncbi:Methyltransferase-like protein 3 [Elsinoe fawcettii]|nr:Methyltransferase-like protein 3 [Elsinoe fawcettii]